jgi:hypothetical protein
MRIDDLTGSIAETEERPPKECSPELIVWVYVASCLSMISPVFCNAWNTCADEVRGIASHHVLESHSDDA